MSSHRLFFSWHPGKRQISAEMNVETKTYLANEKWASLCFMDVVLCTHCFSLNWYLILWWYHENSAVCHLDILWELLQSSRMISISLRTQFIRGEVLIVLTETAEHTAIHKLLLEEMLQNQSSLWIYVHIVLFSLKLSAGGIDLEVNNKPQLWMNNFFWIGTPLKVIVYITNVTLPD